jgi:hypothetical protein
MMYLKSVLAGMVAALVASVIYILAVFVFPLVFPFLMSRMTGGVGMAAAVLSEGEVLGIAIVAFAVGCYWQFRRGSAPRRRAR